MLVCRCEQRRSRPTLKKIALFSNVARRRRVHRRGRDSIYEVPLRFHEEGVDDKIAELLNIWSRAPRLDGWEQRRRSGSSSRRREVDDRLRRQVRRARRVVQEPQRGADPRRHRATTAGSTSSTSTPRRSRSAGAGDARATSTASWSRPASARAAPRARSRRSATRASRRCRSSASASACRWRYRVRAQRVRPRRARTRPSSIRRPPHPVVDLMPEQRGVTDKGATMRLGAYPVRAQGRARKRGRGLRRDRDHRAPPPPLRGQQRLPRRARAATAWCSRACRPTAGWSR